MFSAGVPQVTGYAIEIQTGSRNVADGQSEEDAPDKHSRFGAPMSRRWGHVAL